jgi:TrpR-related protein YerC/YecD
MQTEKNDRLDALVELLAEIRDSGQMKLLLQDLCTVKELENMAERCYAARLLLEGKTYSQVMALADISSATLSRVSRCVQYGSGYARQLKQESQDPVQTEKSVAGLK